MQEVCLLGVLFFVRVNMARLKDENGFEIIIKNEKVEISKIKNEEFRYYVNSCEFFVNGKQFLCIKDKVYCNVDSLEYVGREIIRAVKERKRVFIDFIEPDIEIIVVPMEMYYRFFYELDYENEEDFVIMFLIDSKYFYHLNEELDGYVGENVIVKLEITKDELLKFANEIIEEFSNV